MKMIDLLRKGQRANAPYEPAAEIERLTAELHKANAHAEEFERNWYLRGDEIERLTDLNTNLTLYAEKLEQGNKIADTALSAGDSNKALIQVRLNSTIPRVIHGEARGLTAERDAARELADSEGTRAVNYLRRARKAEVERDAALAVIRRAGK